MIVFNKAISDDIVDFNSIKNYINLDPNITFIEKSEKISRSIENTKFVNYYQYYKGVKVENGGVSEWINTGGGGNPCENALTTFAVNVHVADILDLDINPAIPDSQIEEIIGVSTYSSTLVIKESQSHNCEMKLAYRVNYYEEEKSLLSWIDADSGEIIETISNSATAYFSSPDKINKFSNLVEKKYSESSLVMCDGPIFIYEAFTCTSTQTSVDAATLDGGPMGVSVKPICPIEPNTEAETLFNMLQDLAQAYSTLGITFPEIHAVTNCNGVPESHDSDNGAAYLSVPIDAIDCEVLAHELFHTVHFQLGINSRWNLSEGFADIFGIYFGAICDNEETDWILANSTPFGNRDLMNPGPGKDCVDDGEINQIDNGFETLDIHEYGKALGHWFYLVSDGEFSQGLGSDITINMIMDYLALAEGQIRFESNDYAHFMENMLEIVVQSEGYCSDAHKNFVRSFRAICLTVPPSQACSFSIAGPLSVCEENNELILNVQSNFTEDYRWDYPHNWTIRPLTGNSYINSHVLIVTQFPPEDYPQKVNICATGKTSGNRVCLEVEIKDCNNSTPCESQFRKSQDSTNIIQTSFVRVFSISGIQLYEGIPLGQFEINDSSQFPNGLLILSSYDDDGVLLDSNKVIKTSY